MVGRNRVGELPNLDRFLQFVDGDDLGMVLRSHLALEVTLNMVIASSSPDGLGDLERLPFMTKVDVLALLGKLPPDTRQSFAVANKVRNDFAHHLDAAITENRAAEFLASFHPSTWDGFQFRAHQAALAGTSRDKVAHCFATLFLIAAAYGGLVRELLASLPTPPEEADGAGSELQRPRPRSRA